jgi:pentatricopeptide repeat protein
MKISSRVDGTVCGAVLSTHPSASLTRTAIAPRGRREFCTAQERVRCEPPRKRRAVPGPSFFCGHTSAWLYSTFMPTTPSEPRRTKPSLGHGGAAAQRYGTAAPAVVAKTPRFPLQRPAVSDKAELLSYVPTDGEDTVDELYNFHRDPYRRGYAQPDGPKLEISESSHDVKYPRREEVFTGRKETERTLAKLCSSIGIKLRHPHHRTNESIYKLYMQLPEPRMLNLTGEWRDRLMRIMGLPHKKNTESMLRYFSLVGEVKKAGLTLRRSHWNYAIAFATKYANQADSKEVDSALKLWQQMERETSYWGSNDVTFNVLFDVAAKAGNFELAEMIYKEMVRRKIDFNRFHHVSLIHFFGLKLDSSGIRAAYKEMVDSGEMIDTVALNAVIGGFLKCGEEDAAEETYRKMMSSNRPSYELPPKNYFTDKVMTKILCMFASVSKKHPELKVSLQTNVQLAPDFRTYKILVEYYAVKAGDLSRVTRYLDEMQYLNIPIHPTIFLALLKGFYVHGGLEDSQWTATRLENVLGALYEARDENARGFRIDTWLVIWALRAVQKCSTTEAVVNTYDEMQQRWDVPRHRVEFMDGFFANVVRGRDMTTHRQHSGTLLRRYPTSGLPMPN